MSPNDKRMTMTRTSPLVRNKLRLKLPSKRRNPGSQSSRLLKRRCRKVLFLVGKQKRPFWSHPYLFTMVSDVFRVLFCSWYSDVIEISDVEPSAFEVLIQFSTLYLLPRRRGFTAVERLCKLTDLKLFLSCYYLGHKYNIRSFVTHLENSVCSLINADNVLEILTHADMYQSPRLRSYCWSHIERNTTKVVNSDSFPHLPWDQFCAILENDRLTIREYELFQGAMRWCRAQRQGMQAFEHKIFAIIGVAVYKIRFPLMTRQEFQLTIQSGILKQGEIQDLEHNFRRNQLFMSRRRKNVCFCRSNKIPCLLCTIFPQITTAAALDGRVNIPLDLELPLDPIRFLKAIKSMYRSNCMCVKYTSCPALPNGATGNLMQFMLQNEEKVRRGAIRKGLV